MKKIKLSSALKRTVSFVLAIMILTSVFTVSGLVVSADSEEGNSASTESEKVDIYVKTADDVIPYIDINNTRSTVNEENGLYKFTLDKGATYSLGYYKQLDDDNYVYFSYGNISEWNDKDLYIYCWNDNDTSKNAEFPGEKVTKENPENTIYYKSGNEYITMANTYRVQFDSKYGNIIFSTGSNECQTVDLKLQKSAFYGLSGNIATADELPLANKYDVIDHDAKAYEFFPFYQNKTANENSYIDFKDSTAKEISPIVKYEYNELSDDKDNPTVIGDVKKLYYNNEYFENYFEIKDENNNGITELNVNIKSTEITLKTYYVKLDNTAPDITDILFDGKSVYSVEDLSNPKPNPSSDIEITEYGYYFKEKATVTVKANDPGDKNSASGVKEIWIEAEGKDENGNTIHLSNQGKLSNNGQGSLEIPANFKGNVWTYAVDNVGNSGKDQGKVYYPNKSVVEDEQMHKSVSSINIDTTEKTSRKDANDLDLFNTDVNVPITVEDRYSGIGMIEYRVESNYDTGNNYKGKVEVANKKQSYDGWNVNTWDENLATSMSTTLKVQNNSNDITIWVRLTDRAGNTSEQEKHISIDKTASEITISYDNDSHTTRDGTDYFKADRTATITVKERNFNPDDIIYKITNSDGAVPSLSGWADKPDSSDPDNSIHTATVTYSADGDYTFDISYTDMAGNKANNIEQHKFTLDKTAPEIIAIDFSLIKTESKTGVEKVLNLLSFGLFSNDKIKITVTAEDAQSGVEQISLNTKDFTSSSFVKKDGKCGQASFTLECPVQYNVADLKFTTKDKAGNSKIFNLSNLLNNVAVSVTKNSCALTDKEKSYINNTDKFLEIVSKTDGPGLKIEITDNDVKSYADNNEKSWYNVNIKFKATATDNEAGIASLSGTLKYSSDYNGSTDDEAQLATVPTENYQEKTNKTKSATISRDCLIENKKLNDGRYTFDVKASNNSGNSSKSLSTVYIDQTPPEITRVAFVQSDESSPLVRKYGVYDNKEITVRVYAEDSGCGVKNISLYNNKDIVDSGSEIKYDEKFGYYREFKLVTQGSPYSLAFSATDNLGNTCDVKNITGMKGKVGTINSSDEFTEIADITDDFEVRVEKTSPNVEISYEANGEKAFNDKENSIFHGDKLTATIKLTDEASGLKNIDKLDLAKELTSTNFSVTYNESDVKAYNNVETLKNDFAAKTQDTKITKAVITFNIDISACKSGKYSNAITVFDNAGNSSDNNSGENSKDFYVDNTAPEITGIEFADCNEGFDKVLHFLTFGIYSSGKIKVTVAAKDSVPSSGFDKNGGIEVTDENRKDDKIGEAEIEQRDSSSSEADTTAKYVFTLENADQAYKLKFRAWDNANNSTDETSLSGFISKDFKNKKDNKDYQKVVNIPEYDEKYFEDFEVVSNGNGPEITEFEVKNKDNENYKPDYVDGNGNCWYKDEVYFNATVKDNSLSHIHSITGKVNDSDAPLYDSENKKEIPEKFTTYQESTSTTNTTNSDQIVDSKVDSKSIFTNSYAKSGKYEFKLLAESNNGNTSSASKTVYIDTVAPDITDILFNGKSVYSAGDLKGLSDVVKYDDKYGYYFKEKATVTVKANDPGDKNSASGVEKILIEAEGKDENGNTIHLSNEDQGNLEIPANFKGNVWTYAVDNVGNSGKDQGKVYYPNKSVVEDEQMHKSVSSINIDTTEKTSRKDANDLDLFNTDVNVPITVEDRYSGIGMIEYRVESNYDTGNNYKGKVEVANKKQSYDGWNVNTWDENLATSMSTTLKVQNNSNDITIWVRLTDRAGNTSEQEKHISIDKTASEITISYDNDSHTTRDGTDYFKADRTATITVKERNFNPDDIIYKITNSDGAVPSLSGWADKPDSSDPDNSIHTATVTYSADGDYTFDISYTDMAGNKANNIEQHKFTLDKTLPKISVEFDNNSAHNSSYFKADRTATITIDEHNFSAADVKVAISATGADNSSSATPPSVSGWSSRGDVRTATVRFDKDGKYAFTVDYTDLADNAAKQAEVTTFYIDKTAPVVEISNIENDSANSGDVAPVVTLSDNNYSGDYKLSLTRVDINAKTSDVSGDFATTVVPNGNTGATVTYNNFDKIEENDGIYVLTADLTDKAGNSANALVTFSVNRFGSTYAYGTDDTKELITNGYTNAEKDIVISEINVDKLTKSSVTLSVDNSELKPLKVNEDYTVKEDTKTGQWHKYDYTIKRANFADEGSYTIEIASTDQAKNSETNRIPIQEDRKLAIQFVVDKTEPVINIAGVENSKLYQESSKDVTVVCEDSNIDASSLEISIDDKVLKEGTDYVLEKDVATLTATLKVNATNDISAQSIHVSAKDLASNAGNGDVDNFTLSATLLMRFFANTPLVIISALLLAAIAAGVVILVVKRKKENEE